MTRSALVLDGGSGPSLATARSLSLGGWRVVTTAQTRTALSRYVTDTVAIVPADREPARFVEGVGAALAARRFDVVVPATDASVELLWANEQLLNGARILGAGRSSSEIALDKARTLEAADRAGFGTPEWAAPASLEEAREALARIGFPCVVKPRRSYLAEGGVLRSRRHVVIEHESQLEAAVRAQSDGAQLPLLEAYVPGRSLSASVVLEDGRVLALVARETLTFYPIGGGTSVWKRTIAPDDVGVQEAVGLLQSIGYEGLAEVEYQVPPDGRPRLMEIGARVHGWVPLAVAAGVDLPLIAARALLGDDLPDAAPYRVGLQMRWPAGEWNRVREAFRSGAELPPGISRRSVVAGLWPPWRPGMRYDGFDLTDPLPWLPALVRCRVEARRRAPVSP